MKIYTGGTFDCFHLGHVEFLRRCDELGEVTVALNTDDFIKRFKGKPPVMNYIERREVLKACRYVSRVVTNQRGENSGPTIEAIYPDFIVVGTDWLSKNYLEQLGIDEEFLWEFGIGLVFIPYTRDISTTEIIRRIKER